MFKHENSNADFKEVFLFISMDQTAFTFMQIVGRKYVFPIHKFIKKVECGKGGLCSFFFTYNSTFDILEKRIAGNTIECKNCGVEFSNKYDLSEHKKYGNMEVKFNYDKCGMTFKYNMQLEEHKKLITKL